MSVHCHEMGLPDQDSINFSVCLSLQDVLYTICNNCGPVQRIVIFRKNGVQAMIEYPSDYLQFSLAMFLYI